MGFMQIWDVSCLVETLQEYDQKCKRSDVYTPSPFRIRPEESKKKKEVVIEEQKVEEGEGEHDSSAFLTEAKVSKMEKITKDLVFVKQVHRWKAHQDGITSVCFVSFPEMIASCSFDCNVFIWNSKAEKIGSLVLGPNKKWDIIIDKTPRLIQEREEAEKQLQIADSKTEDELF